jgi:hypothetical protein
MPALYRLVQFLVRISLGMVGKQDRWANDDRLGGVLSDGSHDDYK